MVLLGARPRGPPLEEPDAVGAVRHVGEAVGDGLPGRLRGIDRLPVHRAGRVFPQHPRAAAGDAAGQVPAERQLGQGVGRAAGHRLHQVVVRADDVDVRRPAVVVQVPEGAQGHEVRGHGHARGQLAEHGGLGAVLGEQLVGGEPAVVEHLARVVEGRGPPRREDLVERGVPLTPEGRPPGVVERVHVAVAARQPIPERRGAPVAVAGDVMAAVLVRDVPHRQCQVVVVPGRHPPGQRGGGAPEGRRAGAPGLPRAGAEHVAVRVHGQRVGVRAAEPRRRGGRGGGQVDGDVRRRHRVHDLVEPLRGKHAGFGFEP